MSQNKKLFIVLLISYFIINIMAFVPTFLQGKIKNFYASDYNGWVLLLILISIIFPAIIFKKNLQTKESTAWSVIAVLLILATIIYWYISYSISHISLF